MADSYLHVRFDLPSFINFRDINGVKKLEAPKPLLGPPFGQKWYQQLRRAHEHYRRRQTEDRPTNLQ